MTKSRNQILGTQPLYTTAEVSRFIGQPGETAREGSCVYARQPAYRKAIHGDAVMAAIPAARSVPTIPFLGLGEAQVLAGFRRTGVSLQKIRKAVSVLEGEIGVAHALASRKLYTDGATILFDYKGDFVEGIGDLVVVETQQRVFVPIIRQYIERITYVDDWATKLDLPVTRNRVVQVDPARSFGQPLFLRGAARVEDVIDRWAAGDSLTSVAKDFGVPVPDIEEVLRAWMPSAA